MAVPNTDTFTLQNVVDEVGPTTDDLVDCFSDAVAADFDSSYSGSKNKLLNFRNYGMVGLNEFVGSAGQSGPTGICAQTTSTTYYHDGTGSIPVAGNIVYLDSSGTFRYTAFQYMMTEYQDISGQFLNIEFKTATDSGEIFAVNACLV